MPPLADPVVHGRLRVLPHNVLGEVVDAHNAVTIAVQVVEREDQNVCEDCLGVEPGRYRCKCEFHSQLVDVHRATHALLIDKKLDDRDVHHFRLGHGACKGQPAEPLEAVQASPPLASVVLKRRPLQLSVAHAAARIPVVAPNQEGMGPRLRGREALRGVRLDEGADEGPGLVRETRPRPRAGVDLAERSKPDHLVLPCSWIGNPQRRVERAVAH
mmetsp:Transcript_98518/g.294199  ORF Transcript_98518/g.294199 Transcript_98518/m.294199 type:complete len:215 (+) Transcript_98518:366-1010(+)